MTQVVQVPNYREIRKLKILEYVERQSKFKSKSKCVTKKGTQEWEWLNHRMKGNARTWMCWDGTIEEWRPWGFTGEAINIWRVYKK